MYGITVSGEVHANICIDQHDMSDAMMACISLIINAVKTQNHFNNEYKEGQSGLC